MDNSVSAFFGIDPRFSPILSEFDAFNSIFLIIKDQLPSIVDNKKQSTQRQIKRFEREPKSLMSHMFILAFRDSSRRLTEISLPRFFYGPMITTLYAICESAIIEIANYLKKEKKCPLAMKDIRGGNFLDQVQKYYKHVLQFDLINDGDVWRRFKALLILRHAIAHANGRLDMIEEKRKRQIRELVKIHDGISTSNGFLIVSEDFIVDTYSTMRRAFDDLIKRVQSAYPIKQFEVQSNA